MLIECGGRQITHQSCIRKFSSIFLKKNHGWWPKQFESAHERTVFLCVVRDIHLELSPALHLRDHLGIGEGELLHFKARGTPVRIEIEHHRAVGVAQHLIEGLHPRDALKLHMRFGGHIGRAAGR